MRQQGIVARPYAVVRPHLENEALAPETHCSARSLGHLISVKTRVRGRQADSESGDGQAKQDLARLEQVRDLRRAEQLELSQPGGILLRPCKARALQLLRVMPDLVGLAAAAGWSSRLLS